MNLLENNDKSPTRPNYNSDGSEDNAYNMNEKREDTSRFDTMDSELKISLPLPRSRSTPEGISMNLNR